MHRPYHCLTDSCPRPPALRGVCRACYISHRRAITRGEATWEQLERAGVTRAPRSREERGNSIAQARREAREAARSWLDQPVTLPPLPSSGDPRGCMTIAATLDLRRAADAGDVAAAAAIEAAAIETRPVRPWARDWVATRAAIDQKSHAANESTDQKAYDPAARPSGAET